MLLNHSRRDLRHDFSGVTAKEAHTSERVKCSEDGTKHILVGEGRPIATKRLGVEGTDLRTSSGSLEGAFVDVLSGSNTDDEIVGVLAGNEEGAGVVSRALHSIAELDDDTT